MDYGDEMNVNNLWIWLVKMLMLFILNVIDWILLFRLIFYWNDIVVFWIDVSFVFFFCLCVSVFKVIV